MRVGLTTKGLTGTGETARTVFLRSDSVSDGQARTPIADDAYNLTPNPFPSGKGMGSQREGPEGFPAKAGKSSLLDDDFSYVGDFRVVAEGSPQVLRFPPGLVLVVGLD